MRKTSSLLLTWLSLTVTAQEVSTSGNTDEYFAFGTLGYGAPGAGSRTYNIEFSSNSGGETASADEGAILVLSLEESAGSGQNITGALFTDADTFPAGQLNLGLAGALFTDADTFPAGAVGLGVAGALFVDPDTFPGGVVAREGDSPLAGGGWYAATRRRRRS